MEHLGSTASLSGRHPGRAQTPGPPHGRARPGRCAFAKKWRRGRLDASAPDLLQRDFSAGRPNERWVADITEFMTGEGKLFLAGVKDLYGRGLVGWSMGTRQTSELVIEAVSMAVARRDPVILPLHHSDKGCSTISSFTGPTATRSMAPTRHGRRETMRRFAQQALLHWRSGQQSWVACSKSARSVGIENVVPSALSDNVCPIRRVPTG